jgi:ABC-2 type transport system ATP-binding protein
MTMHQSATQPFGTPTVAVPAAVELRGVTRRYGDLIAVEDLDLEIESGSTVALLGPNGAGKSTTIAMMLGLLAPSAGETTIFGLAPRDAVAGGRVGAMLQSSGLPGDVRVADLIDLVRGLYPAPLSRAEVIDRAGLDAIRHRRVESLSGGEQQRLRFALAIVGDPDLLFLDEPTVGMDVESRRAFWDRIGQSAAEGRTILFATHYLQEADQVADRIVVLDHGRLIADGTPGEIKSATADRSVRFTLPDADLERLGRLPGVRHTTARGASVELVTTDADATVAALYESGLTPRALEVVGADLESAFVALTHPTNGDRS